MDKKTTKKKKVSKVTKSTVSAEIPVKPVSKKRINKEEDKKEVSLKILIKFIHILEFHRNDQLDFEKSHCFKKEFDSIVNSNYKNLYFIYENSDSVNADFVNKFVENSINELNYVFNSLIQSVFSFSRYQETEPFKTFDFYLKETKEEMGLKPGPLDDILKSI